MLEDLDISLATAHQQAHLLPRGEGPRVLSHVLQRNHPLLRRGKVLFLGDAEPERPQPQRVAAEDDLVAFAGNDRGRPLRQ